MSLANKLLTTYKQQIRELKLLPSKGGCFEVTANRELLYSKLKTGKFPEEAMVVNAVGKLVKKG
ncbi:MAG: Rdx family protein [Planctomycetes bacterium]|nr:Rdx family protein [Planctomycetota bacterium]